MQQRRRCRGHLLRAIAIACLLLAGCGNRVVVEGRALSMAYDPYRVGGLPAVDGPSGLRPGAPAPGGTVRNTDGGPVDRSALLAINDIEDFWAKNYSQDLPGLFTPVANLMSYDSDDPNSPSVCGGRTYQLVNAGYCASEDVMVWDRGTLIPLAQHYYGDMSVNAILAHEYGHAVQLMAYLVDGDTPGLVAEQQADCFAGVYLRWVAEGRSPRFTLSTTEDLDHILAGAIMLRDRVVLPIDLGLGDPHGSALDRISALQIGFDRGDDGCAKIDIDEIKARQVDLPVSAELDSQGNLRNSQSQIDDGTLSALMGRLGKIFVPAAPPTLTTEPAACPDAKPSQPAGYCPATNTISVDLGILQEMGKPADEESQGVVLQGDNTAISVVTSRYMLALEHAAGARLDTAAAALRTACLTGVAQRRMAEPSSDAMVLTSGDLDEAVAGLLTNGLVASDVDGSTVPAGFTRILAFRIGLLGDEEQCYQRFS